MGFRNKEDRVKYYREYYQRNKEKFKDYVKKWQRRNKNKIQRYKKEYHSRPDVKERLRDRAKIIYESDPKKREYIKEWVKKKRKSESYRKKEYLNYRRRKDINPKLRERIKKQNNNYYHKNKTKRKQSLYNYRKRNRIKENARTLAQKRIELKDKCESCSSKENLHRHHLDYNQPLNILTLCSICHGKEHRKILSV